jgi:RNA polymerase sigma-70 factor (ECF subfamily)
MSTHGRAPEADDGPGADARLARRAAAGDAEAFDAIVRRFKDRVLRVAHRFLRRPEDVEEIAQEVFLKAYRALPDWRADAPLEHWLLRIATNACRDALRERKRRPATALADLAGDRGTLLDRALEGAAVEAAEAEEARRVAADLLDALPPRDRVVLVLLDLEGMSTAEAAAATGSTRGAVKIRAMRARRALRRLAQGVGRRIP